MFTLYTCMDGLTANNTYIYILVYLSHIYISVNSGGSRKYFEWRYYKNLLIMFLFDILHVFISFNKDTIQKKKETK